MEVLSLCLSDIDKTKIKAAGNGKKYLNIVVDRRKEPDKYDNTLTVYIQQTKEERQEKVPKIYIGAGKEYVFKSETPHSVEDVENLEPSPEDDMGDLPF